MAANSTTGDCVKKLSCLAVFCGASRGAKPLYGQKAAGKVKLYIRECVQVEHIFTIRSIS